MKKKKKFRLNGRTNHTILQFHVKDDSSIIMNVTLGQLNPKTNQIEKVTFHPPKELVPPQPSNLEARHYAATYTLHRVASQKNLKMVLPGAHKDLWAKLDQAKKETPANKQSYYYAQDPFLAERERKGAIEKKQKEDEAKKRDDGIKKIQLSKGNNNDTPQSAKKRKVRFNNVLAMSKELQLKVEELIRTHHGFNMLQKKSSSDGSGGDEDVKSDLTKLGFLPFQISEALLYSNTLSGTLEWLLIHIPEDDLPTIFTEKNHRHHVTANIQKPNIELKTEYAIRQIKPYGYGEDVIYQALTSCGDSKPQAMVKLTQDLVYGSDDSNKNNVEGDDDDIWADEVQSLIAIYGEENVVPDDDDNQVAVTVMLQEPKQISITFWKNQHYPQKIPGIGIIPNDDDSSITIPKYSLLNLIKQTGKYAAEKLEGDFMMSSIIEWLNDNITDILNNPPKLSDISGAISGDVVKKPSKNELASSSTPNNVRRLNYVTKSAQELKESYNSQLQNSGKLKSSLQSRANLPAWEKTNEIVKLIQTHQVVLVTGETGSGKSTQVVQFILDEMIQKNQGNKCNIICTQPRRISAMGLAQRVADERDSKVGDTVGYSIRGETKASSDTTMIRFVTAGVLLRMLQSDPLGALNHVSHVVVDEVHERSLDSSYLLILLKRLLKRNKNLKVILMSATVDTTAFFNYFQSMGIGYAHIEGRTFPVTDYYLDDVIKTTKYVPKSLMDNEDDEKVTSDDVGRIIIALRNGIDYSLISHVVNYIDSDLGPSAGSILIFMSGAAEIDNVIASLSDKYYALPLHASLTPAEQRRVFDSAPRGQRKVVVSTNVAETSITIPDVVAVIDSGRVKATVYEPENNIVRLVDSWASQAEVTQRRGRAGRVQQGICYKLYTRNIQENEMAKEPAPEMQRAPLEQLYLSVKAMGINDTQKFLSEALDPPEDAALETARNTLIKNGALDHETGELTPLGKHISTIPADIRCAKLLILSAIFGCLNKGLTIASILTMKSPFISPREKRDEAKEALMKFNQQTDNSGDLLAAANAYEEWVVNRKRYGQSKVRSWCKENFLSMQTLFDIESNRRQFLTSLQEVGYIPTSSVTKLPSYFNEQEYNYPLIRALLGAAMTPNLAEIVFPERVFKTTSAGAFEQDPEARGIKFFTQDDGRVFVHPSSTMFSTNKFVGDSHYLSFGTKMSTTKLFVNNLTPLGTYGMVFFSQGQISVDPLGSGVIVKDWIGLKCWPRVGILIKLLGNLFNQVLEEKFIDPQNNNDNEQVLSLVRRIIETEGK